MQVGIVSDTHDNARYVERAVSYFEQQGVDAVVHCGDFVAPFSATPFDADFDFYAVRGNNDGEWALQNVVGEFGTYLGEMGELTFDGTDFAVYHGTSRPIVDALVDCGRYDYVVHGHTHEKATEERNGTVRINPGGIPIPDAPAPPNAVVVETDSGAVHVESLSD
ncbi:metallophosphoesterase [Haloarculaceae archaeon H-GB11]|nr:metallophosphoesterase [Haloarculaceae archaeon H-GB1-1]MEA5389101.1 metallophosphoesterase [Haloarculaceae archaeon H-GB11]